MLLNSIVVATVATTPINNETLGTKDDNAVISSIDPKSKIKMTEDGLRPANPFPRQEIIFLG